MPTITNSKSFSNVSSSAHTEDKMLSLIKPNTSGYSEDNTNRNLSDSTSFQNVDTRNNN